MPVYLVTVTEAVGGQRPFDYVCDAPLKKGDTIREPETGVVYQAWRVRHTPEGLYDGEVDADWAIGSPPATP